MPQGWVQTLWMVLVELPFPGPGAAIPAQHRLDPVKLQCLGVSATAEVCTYPAELQATRI